MVSKKEKRIFDTQDIWIRKGKNLAAHVERNGKNGIGFPSVQYVYLDDICVDQRE